MAKHAMWLKILPSLVRYNDVTGQKVGPDDASVWGHVSTSPTESAFNHSLQCELGPSPSLQEEQIVRQWPMVLYRSSFIL